MKAKATWSRWATLTVSALVAVGCAQSNGDINRVQPNATKKSDLLDGVWYYRNTVTWAPATTGAVFSGMTGTMEKIVFEVQQKYLVGYRAYPRIPGTDLPVEQKSKVTGTTTRICSADGKCSGGHPYYGSPVIAYPIEGHFDIQRNYNPTTGETGNVIEENSNDRPWNERDYIRVDWTMSSLGGFDSSLAILNTKFTPRAEGNGSGGASAASSWIQANEKGESPDDWPHQERDASGKLTYFDITARYLAAPDMYYYEGYGYIPYCWVDTQIDCSSTESRVRQSFARVDPVQSRQYEPIVYTNDFMSKFGYFRRERLNYDRKYGFNDTAVIRLGNRHRIWESSYELDADGNVDTSRPLPLAARTPKPIVYYFTPEKTIGSKETYAEIWEMAKRVETEWNPAFQRAVAAAQGTSTAPQMLYVCQTPVPEGAPEACGKKDFAPRFGDVRYNFLHAVVEATPNGLLGYGPSSDDPETGEIISANANIYYAPNYSIARDLLDNMDLITGDLTIANFIRGGNVADYIRSNPAYSEAKLANAKGALQAELQGIPQKAVPAKGAFEVPSERMKRVVALTRQSGGFQRHGGNTMAAAAQKLAQNPRLESMLIDNAEISQNYLDFLPRSFAERAEKDPAFGRSLRRRALLEPNFLSDLEGARQDFASRNNLYLADFYNRTLMSIAKRESEKRTARMAELTSKGMSTADARAMANEEIMQRFRQAIWLATAAHEIGHTFGLRHNFQGSFDAMNYPDVYWDLKRPTLTVQQNGEAKIPFTPADLRAASDSTLAAQQGGQYDNEYSSIMDYSGQRHTDWEGIGKYDRAAILFMYSGDSQPGYVEVFETARPTAQTFNTSNGATMTVSGAGVDVPWVNIQHTSPGVKHYAERFHYLTLPLHFGEGADINAVIDDGIKKLRTRKLMKWSEVKTAYDAVAEQVRSMPAGDPMSAAGSLQAVPKEVPYLFCTDDQIAGYTRTSILSCNRFDRGPDYFEINRQYLEDHWNGYFDTHFRRTRQNWWAGWALYSANGTFVNVGDIYRHWVKENVAPALSTNSANDVKYPVDPLIQNTWTMAVLDGVNAHLQGYSTPDIGLYGLKNGAWELISGQGDMDPYCTATPGSGITCTRSKAGEDSLKQYYGGAQGGSYPQLAVLERGMGKRQYGQVDWESGFGFQRRSMEAGYYYDTLGLMFAEAESSAYFPTADQIGDGLRYTIPQYLMFGDEVRDVHSRLWREEALAPTLYAEGSTGPNGMLPMLKTALPRVVTGPVVTQAPEFVNYPAAPEAGIPAGALKAGNTNLPVAYMTRMYSMYIGMAAYKSAFDLSYAQDNQVFRLGLGEQQAVPTGYHLVEAVHPVNGARYVAIEKDGAAPNSTTAIRMLNRAKQSGTSSDFEVLDIMRDFYFLYGGAF